MENKWHSLFDLAINKGAEWMDLNKMFVDAEEREKFKAWAISLDTRPAGREGL